MGSGNRDMQDSHLESLSAWVDGESARDESRFLARRLDTDPALRETLARWSLVGACLRGERIAPVDIDFAGAVAARIEREALPRTRAGWLRPVAGGAIAAGVAALALMVSGPVGEAPVAPGPVAGTSTPTVPVLAAQAALRTDDLAAVLPLRQVSETWAMPLTPAVPVAPVETLDPAVEAYFLRHSAGASASARAGFVPYVNMVAWPAARPAVATQPGAR